MLRLVLAVCLLLPGGPAPTRDSRDTVGYWSRERIVNARPADLLPFPRLDVAPPDSAPPEVPLGYGARRTVPGRKVLTPGGDRLGYSLVARPYTGAHRLAGILLSHDPVAGTDIACGAAVIRSRSRSLVLTAAHCLYAGGRPLSHVAFLPAYNSLDAGRSSRGVWPAVRVWVPRRWRERPYSPEQLPYDFGVAGVMRGDKLLEEVTGPGLRPLLTPRRSAVRGLELLGYPVGRSYPGTDMYRCLGDAVDGGAAGPGVLVTHNCQAANGTSGGPAVRAGVVAGVVSSSSPLREPAGFTVLTRLTPRPFGRLLARADHVMRH
ncbi:trypsin-like serine peptidase [Nonomuraea dietziae]|uniref:trypsin-like serine peptidase n=1 Tax=Nonomuraea dietziae TaxID=65515 RepID=UPI00341EF904